MNQKLKPVDDQEQPPPLVVDPTDILYSIDLNGAQDDRTALPDGGIDNNSSNNNNSNISVNNINNNNNNRNSFGANSFKSDDLRIDVRGVPEYYRTDDDSYRPFTIYGNHHGEFGDGNDKLSVLPASTTGSLSSIITTSVASSEPDRGDHRDGGVGGGGDDDEHNVVATTGGGKCLSGIGGGGHPGGHGGEIKQEKWWETTLQISIPFFIAGIGTIGAGIILGDRKSVV